MRKQHYKILLLVLYVAAIASAIYLLWWYLVVLPQDKSRLAPKYYDATIVNQNTDYSKTVSNTGQPYELPYLRIKNIAFFSDPNYLYLRFQLGGTLPSKDRSLPLYDNDQIKDIYYTMTLDENYFDFAGNKNPGGPEAELKINLYSTEAVSKDNRIDVQGELLKGGPGYDYFVVRYPYQQLLMNRNSEFIVFTAYASVTTSRFPAGASSFEFRNSTLAATPQNDREVVVDLSLKDLKY